MVEKGVPLAQGGVVASHSNDGQNHPSAVATEAAEHPQDAVLVKYEACLRRRLEGLSTEVKRSVLTQKKQANQSVIDSQFKEIAVFNKLLAELEK